MVVSCPGIRSSVEGLGASTEAGAYYTSVKGLGQIMGALRWPGGMSGQR